MYGVMAAPIQERSSLLAFAASLFSSTEKNGNPERTSLRRAIVRQHGRWLRDLLCTWAEEG